MKFTFFIDKEKEEEVVVYAHERSCLVDKIERLVSEQESEIVGYKDRSIIKINLSNVYCFMVENGKTYAVMENDRLLVKNRLYQIEGSLGDSFIKINQSCIANINKIERFDTSFSGTLLVVFRNGHSDYVSRRQVKMVKERIGV